MPDWLPLVLLLAGLAASGTLGVVLFSRWLTRNDRKWIAEG
jgi:hypothetical protein